MANGRVVIASGLLLTLAGCSFHRATPTDLYVKGKMESDSGNLDAAIASLSKAIDRNPKMGLAYVARGEAYKTKGDLPKAASDFEEACKLEPFDFHSHYELGLTYQYMERYSDAVAAYQQAIEIRPLDPDANMNLAMAYTAMGQPFRGLAYAQRAVDRPTAAPSAFVNLGILYGMAGKDDQSIDALKHALEMNGKIPEVYLNLGEEYIKTDHLDQAQNVLETGQKIAPSPAISERLGYVCYRQRNLDGAKAAFEDAIKQKPGYYPALNGLGVVTLTTAQASGTPDAKATAEAVTYFKQSLTAEPNQPAIQQLVAKYAR